MKEQTAYLLKEFLLDNLPQYKYQELITNLARELGEYDAQAKRMMGK